MALGRFVVCYSKVQNIFQEGIYCVTAKLNSLDDPQFVRCFMHRLSVDQLEDIFLTLISKYACKAQHIDKVEFKAVRKTISKQSEHLKEVRNRVMHSVWNEKFWEGKPGEHLYRMIYHKNKQFQFTLDEEEFDYEKLNKHAHTAICLSQFIHDFLICVVNGDTHPDKSLKAYFQFRDNEAVFPRKSDLHRFQNIDDNI